jgi:hypothetical protein
VILTKFTDLTHYQKGHIPSVPHTMMSGWEDIYKVPRACALQICYRWIEKCDALYFISPSIGAESEREIAIKLNMPIYYNLDDIYEVNINSALESYELKPSFS